MSSMLATPTIVLEPAAQAFALATATTPFLFQLGPAKGREALDEVQSGAIEKPDVVIEDTTVPGGPSGHGSIRIGRPKAAGARLPVVLCSHGAGWVFGNARTHDRLIRELAVGTDAAVIFPNYSPSPEARYPTAIEEIYADLAWFGAHGAEKNLDEGSDCGGGRLGGRQHDGRDHADGQGALGPYARRPAPLLPGHEREL
jgi:acetyl esterase